MRTLNILNNTLTRIIIFIIVYIILYYIIMYLYTLYAIIQAIFRSAADYCLIDGISVQILTYSQMRITLLHKL